MLRPPCGLRNWNIKTTYGDKFETSCTWNHFEWKPGFKSVAQKAKKHQKDVKKMRLPTAILQQKRSFCFYKFLCSKWHILLIPSSPKVFCSSNSVSTSASACSYISNSSNFFHKPNTQWCVTERNGTLANWFLPSQGIHSVVPPPTLT